MEPIELNPMSMIQAQRERIVALMDENVQLTAAVVQLQTQVAALMEVPGNNGEVELDPDAREFIKDVTDEVVGAEITS